MRFAWVISFIHLATQSEISQELWNAGRGQIEATTRVQGILSNLKMSLSDLELNLELISKIVPETIELSSLKDLDILEKWGTKKAFLPSFALTVIYWGRIGRLGENEHIEEHLFKEISDAFGTEDVKLLMEMFGDFRFRRLKAQFLCTMLTLSNAIVKKVSLKYLVFLVVNKLFSKEITKKSLYSAISLYITGQPIQDKNSYAEFDTLESMIDGIQNEMDHYFNEEFGDLSDGSDTFKVKRHLLSLSRNEATFLLQWKNVNGGLDDRSSVPRIFISYVCKNLTLDTNYCLFFDDFLLSSPDTLSEAIINWWSSLGLGDPTQISFGSWDDFLKDIFNNICVLVKNQIGSNPYGLTCDPALERNDDETVNELINPIAKLVEDFQRDSDNNCILQNPNSFFDEIRELGRGGGGSVTLVALKENPNVKVALKRIKLRPAQLSLPEEIVALRKMAHPNVIRFFDCFCERTIRNGFASQTTLWIAMEYAPVNLQEFVDYFKVLESGVANLIARSIINGLNHIHSQGFVHLDIKPANIAITLTGDVKIIDFGLAIPENNSAHLLRIRGTPGFTAPEMYAEKKSGIIKGRQADIWSFGMLLHYLLDGSLCELSDNGAFLTSLLGLNCSCEDMEKFSKWELEGEMIRKGPTESLEMMRGLFKDCLELDPTKRIGTGSIQDRLLQFPVDPIGLKKLVSLLEQAENGNQN